MWLVSVSISRGCGNSFGLYTIRGTRMASS